MNTKTLLLLCGLLTASACTKAGSAPTTRVAPPSDPRISEVDEPAADETCPELGPDGVDGFPDRDTGPGTGG